MANNFFGQSGAFLLQFIATYWMHSTILLSSAWLFLRWSKQHSHLMQERVWKYAAITGLVSTSLQIVLGMGNPIGDLALRHSDQPTADSVNNREAVGRMATKTAATNVAEQQGTADLSRETIDLGSTIDLVRDSIGRKNVPQDDSQHVNKGPNSIGALIADQPILFDPPNSASESQTNLAEQRALDESPETDISVSSVAMDNQANGQPNIHATLKAKSSNEDRDNAKHARIGLVVMQVIFCGWFFACVLILIWQTLRFRRLVSNIEPANSAHQHTLDKILDRLGIAKHRIRLGYSECFSEPVACGIWTGLILLPKESVKQLDALELEALLAHEVAHLVRGDIAWLQIARVLKSCFAFQPLNFLAVRRWNLAAEFLCDDWAVNNAVDPIVLAKSLTTVAAWRTPSNAPLIDDTDQTHRLQGAFATGRSHVTQRVERLLQSRESLNWPGQAIRNAIRAIGLLVVVGLVVSGPRMLAQDQVDRENRTSSSNPAASDNAGGYGSQSAEHDTHGVSETKSDDLPTAADQEHVNEQLLQELLIELRTETVELKRELGEFKSELAALEKLAANEQLTPAARANLEELLRHLILVQHLDPSATNVSPSLILQK